MTLPLKTPRMTKKNRTQNATQSCETFTTIARLLGYTKPRPLG